MKTLTKEELRQLYDKDFPLWVEVNLELLKDKAYYMVDWDNLLEEIKDMGHRHLDACISYLAVILEHLYKIDNFKYLTYAGESKGGQGWRKSILNSRTRINTLFKVYPSLKAKLPYEIETAWKFAAANLEIWLRDIDKNPEEFNIPESCPYSYEEAMSREV